MTGLTTLVLAGGESRRMGRDKAGITNDGLTQLERTVQLARSVSDEVFVSVRRVADADAQRRAFALIEDDTRASGPLAGILAALTLMPERDWLVLACDLPRLDAPTLSALQAAAIEDSDSPAIAIASEQDGALPEPLCAVWRAAMLPTILSQSDAGKFCPRKCLLIAEARKLAPVTTGALDNMNTPEDLARIVGGRR
ncbi:MAG: molybdenum cofactor guanylyltransferase [Pseudomonadota bacterium]